MGEEKCGEMVWAVRRMSEQRLAKKVVEVVVCDKQEAGEVGHTK